MGTRQGGDDYFKNRRKELSKKNEERQLNKKAKSGKVRLMGEIVEKCRIERGITSQEETAFIIKCKLSTYKRAISGVPILQKTAEKICAALGIDIKMALVMEPGKEPPPQETSEENTGDISTRVLNKAYEAAEDIISDMLRSHEKFDYYSISTVMVMLLTRYTVGISPSSPTAFLLLDDISARTRETIKSALSDETFLSFFEPDS